VGALGRPYAFTGGGSNARYRVRDPDGGYIKGLRAAYTSVALAAFAPAPT